MKKFILNSLFATASLTISVPAFSQVNDECSEMEPICTDAGLNFTAEAAGGNVLTTQPGNNYGCLGYSPNPTWYYLEVGVAGTINMNLWAPQDIDFIIWGPYPDLGTAQSLCGSLGTGGASGTVIDCSYSSTNDEYPDIVGATVGQVYVMLITNFAGVVQDLTLEAVPPGTGATDCSIVMPQPCVSDPGTYVVKKNGLPTATPVYLCDGESIDIESDGNYILPNDTIPLPIGDGVYSAQLMWLVYDALPLPGTPPNLDPGFLNFIIPDEDISDVNNGTSPVIAGLGCGKYYFVPVAGDDGIGGNNNVANGTNDNGGLHWDKDGNNCYLLGTPVEVEYACPITTVATVDCTPPTVNGMNIVIDGGATGNYTVVNQGEGNLTPTSVPHGGTANVNNLENNDVWEIDITDSEGCTASATGIFEAPVFNNITIIPALTCPLGGNGDVNVAIVNGSGNGGPYTIVMNTDPPTPGLVDTYSNVAGTAVSIVITDASGCVSDSTVTITSAGHFIDVDVVALSGELCYGDGNGSATISAVPTPSGSVTNITWNGPSGQTPGGNPGGPGNTNQSGLEPGNWTVTVLDNTGCEVTIPITITSPQELDLYLANSNEPVCYDFSDGSITVNSTGGSGTLTYTWNPVNSVPGNTFNNLQAGIYTAYVTDANGCSDSLVIDLGQPDSLYADFFIKDILCFGDSTGGIFVTDVYNEVGTVNYHWNLQGIAPNPPSTSSIADNLPIGTYVVTIQDALCQNQYEFTLVQNPVIEFVEFGMEPAHCRLYSYQSGNGVVYASATGGVPDYEYEWVNLTTGATTNNTTWGGLNYAMYQMTVTDDVGCTLVQTIQLDTVSPIADFNVISPDLSAGLEGTAVVCADFENTSQYFANPNDPNADTTFFWEMGYDLPWQISHDFYEVFDSCYYVEGEFEVCLVALNKNGCSDTACKVLFIHDYPILIAPNIFTPGGDGANEVFTFNSLQKAIVQFECTIVDRWGKLVFEYDEITDGWDGNHANGNPADDGVYFYTYTGLSTNGTRFEGQGTVQLVRGQ